MPCTSNIVQYSRTFRANNLKKFKNNSSSHGCLLVSCGNNSTQKVAPVTVCLRLIPIELNVLLCVCVLIVCCLLCPVWIQILIILYLFATNWIFLFLFLFIFSMFLHSKPCPCTRACLPVHSHDTSWKQPKPITKHKRDSPSSSPTWNKKPPSNLLFIYQIVDWLVIRFFQRTLNT